MLGTGGTKMSKCENCIHYGVCLDIEKNIKAIFSISIKHTGCEYFKDKSLFVELPCKVGDSLYYIATCKTAEDFGKKYVSWDRVKQISINAHGNWVYLTENSLINFDEIGKVIFLTKEEAEQKLQEMESRNDSCSN
jgi:hypothetical protein